MRIKRLLDVSIATMAIILSISFWLVIAILIKIESDGPVFFRQVRPGLCGRPFTLIKFRTMTNAQDVTGNLLPDGMRLTRFGRILRAMSMDELPELINVLKGEMSLVGPRPILIGVRGDAADLVRNAGAGIICEPENEAVLAQSILQLYRMGRDRLEAMGARGREFYLKEMSLDIGGAKMDALLREVAGKHRGREAAASGVPRRES